MAIMIMVFVSIMVANQGMFLLVMAFSFLAAQIVSKQVAIKIIEVILIKISNFHQNHFILVKFITTKHRAGAHILKSNF